MSPLARSRCTRSGRVQLISSVAAAPQAQQAQRQHIGRRPMEPVPSLDAESRTARETERRDGSLHCPPGRCHEAAAQPLMKNSRILNVYRQRPGFIPMHRVLDSAIDPASVSSSGREHITSAREFTFAPVTPRSLSTDTRGAAFDRHLQPTRRGMP